MAFNEDLYKKVVELSSQEIVSDTDSVWAVADDKVKDFLDNSTDIDDTKKAEFYANFVKEMTTSSIQQILQNAQAIVLEQEVNEQKIASMIVDDDVKQAQSDKDLEVKDSTISVDAQRIVSMQNEDTVRTAQSDKDIEVKTSQILVDEQKVASMQNEDTVRTAQSDKDIEVKTSQILVDEQKVASMQNEDTVRTAQSDKDIEVKSSQIAVDTQKVASMQREAVARDAEVATKVAETKIRVEQLIPAQIEEAQANIQLKESEIKLKGQQVAVEKSKVKLTEKQIENEEARLDILGREYLLKEKENMRENAKLELLKGETEAKVGAYEAEAELKKQQADAVMASIAMNWSIEELKSKTELTKAMIYATGGLKK